MPGIGMIIAFILAILLVIGSRMAHEQDMSDVLFFLGVLAGFTGFLLWIL